MKSLVLLISIVFSFTIYGHGDHPRRYVTCKDMNVCTQAEIEAVAPQVLELMVNKGVVDKSWSSLKVSKVEKKQFKKSAEWVLTYNNPTVKDVKKQNIFVFISMDGYLNGSNYTGE